MRKGDYVFATKYSDGDPGDQYAVGFFDRMLGDRYMVTDGNGNQFRGNGFRRCEPITHYQGVWLIQSFPLFEDMWQREQMSVWWWLYDPF